MGLCMRTHESLADDVSALEVLKGAVQIPSGDKLSSKSDLSIESQAPLAVHRFLSMRPNVRDQRRRAVGAPLALSASGVTTSAERCIALLALIAPTLDFKVHMVVLIVPHPRCAFHEGYLRLDVVTAACSEQLRQVCGIKDYTADSDARGFRTRGKGVEMLSHRFEIDPEAFVFRLGVKFDGVTEFIGDASRKWHGCTTRIQNWNHEVHG